MRLGAAIEASSQEKIVGLTECERAVVEFYRSALKDES
jgi:tRNA isopentenyl-2-thiomethyl-A-37 hydroxylase MiaE